MTKRFEKWGRWAGQFDDVVEAGRVSVASIEKLANGEPIPVEIEVTYPRIIRTYKSLAELESGTDIRDLAEISSFRIRVGHDTDLNVSIHAERKSPAMSLEVTGDDEDQVNAVFDGVVASLNRGRRISAEPIVAFALISGLAIAFGVGYALSQRGLIALAENDPDPPFEGLLTLGLVAMTAVWILGAIWLNPDLQLLPPAGQTRLRRARAVVVTVGLALLGFGVQQLVDFLT